MTTLQVWWPVERCGMCVSVGGWADTFISDMELRKALNNFRDAGWMLAWRDLGWAMLQSVPCHDEEGKP